MLLQVARTAGSVCAFFAIRAVELCCWTDQTGWHHGRAFLGSSLHLTLPLGDAGRQSGERLEEEDVSQESYNPVDAKSPNASSARFSPSVNIVCHCLANFQVTLEVFVLGHGFYEQLCLSKTIIPNWGLPCPYQKALSPQLCQEKGTQALPYLFQARQLEKLPSSSL